MSTTKDYGAPRSTCFSDIDGTLIDEGDALQYTSPARNSPTEVVSWHTGLLRQPQTSLTQELLDARGLVVVSSIPYFLEGESEEEEVRR